ncbi:hypothetical protein BDV25DRAFT_69954 [Aspergillus avenaceus]|uniref:Aminoglycoside phosphotransferase domain-containing protein n=1 Tax=Aspergillus avenaceus TaxID=36643 RepID=A0A5N6U1C2_ASPAV|nr:hypothetical protein BDV25DRAFT_69954 [Aspergillus avenaceus]
MPKSRHLLREDITYSTARKEEVNILHRLGYYDQQNEFFARISDSRGWIQAVVAYHLGLTSPDECQVADIVDWLHGSFNVCVPVTINNWKNSRQTGQRVLLRLPLPYRVGESFHPGNVDEKIRCEAGTYAWLQDNCPDVPIPKLYGFALSTGETFTHIENLPFLSSCFQHLRRLLLSYLNRQVPTRYVPCPSTRLLDQRTLRTGYILVEYIEGTTGEMLSSTWKKRHNDTQLRTNLFRDLARILLSVSQLSLPKIGSLVIDHSGFLQLINRPLSLEIQDLENERIPTHIARDYTYSTVGSYITDILGVHDSRLINQPNAINDSGDYLYQASALTAMRAVLPSFFRRELCRGPFVLSFTDLHPSNIFVDKDWHITALVDLEWACARPVEMIRTPTWLTNQAVDEIAETPEEYDQMRAEFVDTLRTEEDRSGFTGFVGSNCESRLSTIMGKGWESGAFWYSLALASPTGLFSVFYKQIQPRFLKYCSDQDGCDTFHQAMPWYWSQDFVRIGARKLADKKEYDIRLREEFQDE